MADIYNDTNLTYDSYLEPDVDPFVQQILATTAITNINGISGPTVTLVGGTSGFTFAPASPTITLVSPLTAKGDIYTRDASAGTKLAVGTNGQILSADSAETTGLKWITNSTGTVTTVSVVTANGFAGTVATATTTPAITLTTTISGVLKGDGTAISAAASADIITALGYTPTNAAIVPNTAPSAGQILVGNAGNTAYAKQTVSGSGATITLGSTGVITISAIANASLSNSAITIAGTSTALGGSITLDTITGVSSNGFLKRTGANTLTSIADPLPVANGGTNASSASITAFNNITGFSAAGSTGTTSTNLVFSTSPTLTTPVIGVATGTSLAVTGFLSAAGARSDGASKIQFSYSSPNGAIISYGPDTTTVGKTLFGGASSNFSAGDFFMLLNDKGNLKIGSSGADTLRGTTEGTNQVVLFNGTAPAGTLTNGASFFCATGEMKVIDSAGNVTLLSPHDSEGRWIHDEVNFKGRKLRVDMERLVIALDKMLGGGYVTYEDN